MARATPHVLMVLFDDLGYWALGAAGNAEILTPTLDRLSREGIVFANCYCVSPVCSPARASLLTGRIPSQHGVQDWLRAGSIDSTDDRAIEYLAGMRGFSDVLNENGYYCGQIGKWHMGDSYRPQKGFRHWTVTPKGSDNYYGAKLFRNGREETVERYLTDELTDDAVSFVRRQAHAEQPFFLTLNYTAPHRPWRKDQHPPEFWALYDDCAFSSFPDLPSHPWQINNGIYPGEDKTEMLRGYCTATTAADAALSRVLDELDAQGIAEDTLVIFTSDNGMSLGHHGIFGKGNATYPQNMYDQAVKVPFVMRQPGKIVPQRSKALVSHYDFCPTLFDYLNIDEQVGDNLPGRSFLPHVLGLADEGHEEVVVFDEYGPVRMLRNQRWKYIYRLGDFPNELFDLETDPEELSNVAELSENAELVAELDARLQGWFKNYVDPERDALRQQNHGRGQLGRIENAGTEKPAFAQDWFYQSSGRQDSGPNL